VYCIDPLRFFNYIVKRIFLKITTFITGVLLLAAGLPAVAQEASPNIEFVENKGQWDKRVDFKGDMTMGAFFLQHKGFSVLLQDTNGLKSIRGHGLSLGGPSTGGASAAGKTGIRAVGQPAMRGSLRSHAYQVSFVGAREEVEIIPDKPLPGYNNYFIGNDPSKWASKCRIYQGVTYKNIYPNVDVRYYTDNGRLKYDIIVNPGGNVEQIAMKYEGMDKLVTRKKELLINTTVGQVRELSPVSFQPGELGRMPVDCRYILGKDNILRFKLGSYSHDAILVIDPTVVFCSFTGSTVSNWGFTATYGPDGGFYAGGIVFGNGFPTTPGAIQPVFNNSGFDIGIMKFSSDGSTRLYATYLGGEDNETPHSMICDPSGNLIVLGRTYSQDFPFATLVGTNAPGTAKMFVAKFNADGSKLLGCMRIGGKGNDCVNIKDQVRSNNEMAESLIRNYGDDSRSEVVLDASNNILVAASTQSTQADGFPITAGVFQPNFGGGLQDGVVLKINPACNALIWASYLGGGGDDAAFVLKSDPITGDIYVGGATSSGSGNTTPFPGIKAGVLQGTYGGGICDGFLTVISSDGTQQKRTTYLGSSAGDAVYGVQIDRNGFPYVMGTTNGSWPVINANYSTARAKQFVGKLKPDLSAYVYSTTFGTASAIPNISPVAFLVDRCENVYVSGWGGWILPSADPYGLAGTMGMETTGDAFKRATDNRDFYFIVLKRDMTGLLYATFFGENNTQNSISEHVDGGTSRYDQNGVIYQAICANCGGKTNGPFPTTNHVWSSANGAAGKGCNLAALKIAFNFAGVYAGIKSTVNGRENDSSGCVPLSVILQDTVRNATSYIWNFGDGSPDTVTSGYVVTHGYASPGTYLVRMIALNPASCNASDTVYKHILARSDKANLDFNYVKDGLCTSLDYTFTNLSTPPAGKPFGNNSFSWSFSDQPQGSPAIPGGGQGSTTNHSFRSAGTYIVSLILNDTSYCNYPDTLARALHISTTTKAQFVTPAIGCLPYNAQFNNTSLGGEQFFWDFGDGQTSTDPAPSHLYTDTGTFTIRLVVVDTTTCNKTDATQQTISVRPGPTSAFTASPPVDNTPIVFTNGSSGANNYLWVFGDGASESKATQDTALHLYIRSDTFQACLVAYNQYGCTDTACHPVATLIEPLLDVPNAFTPGRFGENGIIKVMGFGITHMTFRIYNRWGELVFQSNDPNIGWDGTFKGTVQPMDVYSYTLEASFSNGKQQQKKGNITLIR
jgi:gliding motility-associated-like protein